MTQARPFPATELDQLLVQARAQSAVASLRAVGDVRLQGDLKVCGMEPGVALHLSGARRRDQLPPRNADVILSLLVGENVFNLQTHLLDPIISTDGDTMFPPIIRVAWPEEHMEGHRRERIRVAAPDLPPLQARVMIGRQWHEAQLLNLTEMGMGMALRDTVKVEMHDMVQVVTTLPGDVSLTALGEVRHVDFRPEDPMKTRLGLVLGNMEAASREVLARFIQARRTDRSDRLRLDS